MNYDVSSFFWQSTRLFGRLLWGQEPQAGHNSKPAVSRYVWLGMSIAAYYSWVLLSIAPYSHCAVGVPISSSGVGLKAILGVGLFRRTMMPVKPPLRSIICSPLALPRYSVRIEAAHLNHFTL